MLISMEHICIHMYLYCIVYVYCINLINIFNYQDGSTGSIHTTRLYKDAPSLTGPILHDPKICIHVRSWLGKFQALYAPHTVIRCEELRCRIVLCSVILNRRWARNRKNETSLHFYTPCSATPAENWLRIQTERGKLQPNFREVLNGWARGSSGRVKLALSKCWLVGVGVGGAGGVRASLLPPQPHSTPAFFPAPPPNPPPLPPSPRSPPCRPLLLNFAQVFHNRVSCRPLGNRRTAIVKLVFGLFQLSA